MYKKIHFVFVNIVPFVLMALLIALPLFDMYIVNSIYDVTPKKIFGFTLLTGFSLHNEGLEIGQQLEQVMRSKLLAFMPLLMLLSIFVIDKSTNSTFGKHIINFLCLAITFAYVLLLPVIAPTSFLTTDFIDRSSFERITGYWIIFACLLVTLIYFVVILLYNVIKLEKETKEKERNA